MLRIGLYVDEYYPYYDTVAYGTGDKFVWMSEEDYTFVTDAMEKFGKAQEILRGYYEQGQTNIRQQR